MGKDHCQIAISHIVQHSPPPAGGQEFKSPLATKPFQLFGGVFILITLYTVYVLHSKGSDKIYIGYSSGNIERRLADHNEKATKGYTLRYRPWTIVYTETFKTKKEAIRREKELKSARGRKFIWEEIIAKL